MNGQDEDPISLFSHTEWFGTVLEEKERNRWNKTLNTGSIIRRKEQTSDGHLQEYKT